MITKEQQINSAHPDYTPNYEDFLSAKELFKISVLDYEAAVLQGVDDSGFLCWADCGNNWYVEHFPTVSGALARLTVLQNCAEHAWDRGFLQQPVEFLDEFGRFLDATIYINKKHF